MWKFNSLLLNDAIFKRELSQLITDQKQCMGKFQTIGVWWNNLKVVIGNFCQKYTPGQGTPPNSNLLPALISPEFSGVLTEKLRVVAKV